MNSYSVYIHHCILLHLNKLQEYKFSTNIWYFDFISINIFENDFYDIQKKSYIDYRNYYSIPVIHLLRNIVIRNFSVSSAPREFSYFR